MFGWIALSVVGMTIAGFHVGDDLVSFGRWIIGGIIMYVGIVRYDREFTK